ncbi:MAG: hypothetical protein OWS03_06100 [Alicyclobacillaceae bacterium]|nr:hypothetical protein [Alicyclobacillaceae bacterium]
MNAEDAWFVTTRPSMPLQNSQKSVHDSLVFRTDDGGKHWTIIRLHHSYLLAWIDFISPLQGWLLASPGPATGQEPCILYYTHDGGKHWRIISSTSDIDFSSQSKHSLPNWNGKTGISFLNSTTGWMTIDDGNKSGVITLYVTHDGGSRWSAQSIAVPKRWKAVYTHPLPPIFSSPTTGVMPVTFSGKNETMFYFTMDSGTHWTTSTPIPEARVLDVVMSNQTTVWTTNGKSVYATINDGDSWVKWTCPHHDKVISLFILKDGLSAIAYTEKKGKITQHQLYIHDMNSFLL